MQVRTTGNASRENGRGGIEKMLGCNFLVHDLDEDMSDEETCAHRTFDDENTSMIINSTFDTISDDEYRSNKRLSRRRGSRSRRKR